MKAGEIARWVQFLLRRRRYLGELDEEMRLHAELGSGKFKTAAMRSANINMRFAASLAIQHS